MREILPETGTGHAGIFGWIDRAADGPHNPVKIIKEPKRPFPMMTEIQSNSHPCSGKAQQTGRLMLSEYLQDTEEGFQFFNRTPIKYVSQRISTIGG